MSLISSYYLQIVHYLSTKKEIWVIVAWEFDCTARKFLMNVENFPVLPFRLYFRRLDPLYQRMPWILFMYGFCSQFDMPHFFGICRLMMIS